MPLVRSLPSHQPINSGRLLDCSRRQDSLDGLHRPSGRTASERDHPINHHVAGPPRPAHLGKAGRPRARRALPRPRSHAPPGTRSSLRSTSTTRPRLPNGPSTGKERPFVEERGATPSLLDSSRRSTPAPSGQPGRWCQARRGCRHSRRCMRPSRPAAPRRSLSFALVRRRELQTETPLGAPLQSLNLGLPDTAPTSRTVAPSIPASSRKPTIRRAVLSRAARGSA
jgi:hypothetical protein